MTYIDFNNKQKKLSAELDSLLSQSRFDEYDSKLREFSFLLASYFSSSSTLEHNRKYFDFYLNHRAPRSDSNMSYIERLRKEFSKNANKQK